MKLHVTIHAEDGSLWAEVAELPGCFATGDTLEELAESLSEGIALYNQGSDPAPVSVSEFAFEQTIVTHEIALKPGSRSVPA